MTEFKLHVPDIDADGRSYAFPIRSEWVREALDESVRPVPSAGDGTLSLHVQRSGDDILVQGRIHTRIATDCVRCLEDARIDVDTAIDALFTAKGDDRRPVPDEEDLSPEELSREFYSGDSIVLDDIVRELIILEVPMQPLCADDCAGIEIPAHVRPPADFGQEKTDDGVDPRLAPLKNLAGKIRQKE